MTTDETLQRALSALSRSSLHDRAAAAKTLRQYPVPVAIDALVAVADDLDPWVAIAAVQTLGQLGAAASRAVPRLCEILCRAAAHKSVDPDDDDHLSALITALGSIGHPDAATTLLSLHRYTPASRAQSTLRRTLPLFDTPAIQAWLAEELARLHALAIAPAIDVRDNAIQLLDELCRCESLPTFVVALHDESYFVRERAIKAIYSLIIRYPQIVTPELVQVGGQCLDDTTAWYTGGPRICDCAATILKHIDTEEAYTVLELWEKRTAM